MVSAEELELLCVYDTGNLVLLLEQKEEAIRFCTLRGLSGSWIADDEMRLSIIKSELGRRGVFG